MQMGNPKIKKWIIKKQVLLASYLSILICIDQNELIPIVRPCNKSTPCVHHWSNSPQKRSKISHTSTNATQIHKTQLREIDLKPSLLDPTQPKDPTLPSSPLGSTPITQEETQIQRIEKATKTKNKEKPNW